jgi:capsular polysaccharide biosynthesis protein
MRDVDTANRAYEAVSSRVGTFTLEGQNNQANTRLLSPAVEPLEPSRPRVAVGIIGSVVGGLVLGMLAALGWELLDRRVRDPEDLMVIAGVPVIGVLRPEGSKRPVFRRLLQGAPFAAGRPLLAAPGVRP